MRIQNHSPLSYGRAGSLLLEQHNTEIQNSNQLQYEVSIVEEEITDEAPNTAASVPTGTEG